MNIKLSLGLHHTVRFKDLVKLNSNQQHIAVKNTQREPIDIYAMRQAINSGFVAFILPSSGFILTIYYTLNGLCQIRSLDGGTYVTKKQLNFGFTPLLGAQKLIASSIYYTSPTFYEQLLCSQIPIAQKSCLT